MYEYEAKMMAAQQSNAICEIQNRTVGENIDAKIRWHREQIAQLEASRETLQPLLNMRIEDLRNAMQY